MKALTVFIMAGALGASGCISTPLKSAVAGNDTQGIERALTAGENINALFPGVRMPPASYACWHGSFDALKLLVQKGADLNGDYRVDPLKGCILMGQVEMARYLVEHGAVIREEHLEDSRKYARKLTEYLVEARGRKLSGQSQPAAHAGSAPAVSMGISSDIDTPSRRGAERPDDYALVIGIEEYQSLPKADFGARDAKTMRRHLEALGFPARNIISLEGSQATGSKLKSYLEEWLPLNVKTNSTLFVYYSGHGAPDTKTGEAYLVPWDGDPKFLKSTALPLKRLYADLAKTKAKRVIVALDACFSGAGGRSVLAQGARPLVAKAAELAPTEARLTILAAASGDEITGTLAEQSHGLFTYHLLKGLSADPKASAKSLYDYLKPRVQDDARRENREQTPVLAGASLTEPLLAP